MKIGLFFGSFNPVHNGHLAIARYLNLKTWFDQIWMVVSPNNPFKEKDDLIEANHRLNMVKLAIQDEPFLWACDVEFYLPIPSYTIDTLHELEKQYTNHQFSLIIGADNWANFYQWKNYQEILNKYQIYVYPRNREKMELPVEHPNIINMKDAPLLPDSATEIRTLIKQNKSVIEYMSPAVIQYIERTEIYSMN
jgi:nicotinate-nucleotide adenylyltransferase